MESGTGLDQDLNCLLMASSGCDHQGIVAIFGCQLEVSTVFSKEPNHLMIVEICEVMDQREAIFVLVVDQAQLL